jgi:hypothetical protein
MMSILRRSVIYTALLLSLAAPSFGDQMAVVPGNEASRENFQVNKRLGWYTQLDQAKDEAAKTGRLVFWVHMLGSMDGKT